MLLAWSILQGQPIIEFESLKHYFGEIKEEAGPHEFSFKFVNAGDAKKPEENSLKIEIIEIQTEKADQIIQSSKGQDELVILDVRTLEEFNNCCIENAININFYSSHFKEMLKLMNKQKTYIVYCQSGIRSRSAVDFMKETGFKKVYHMYKGIAGWRAIELKLIDPNR